VPKTTGGGASEHAENVTVRTLESYIGNGSHSFRVVIPSLDRPDVLCAKTLGFLCHRQKIQQDLIDVWVADTMLPGQTTTEVKRYKAALQKNGFTSVNVKLGVLGLTNQWQKICSSYREGAYLICVLDSVTTVLRGVKMKSGNIRAEPLACPLFKALIMHAADLCCKQKVWLWGLNPAQSLMSLSDRSISRKFGLVQNAVFGTWNRKSTPALRCSSFCLDLELSCRVWTEDGSFLRYGMLTAKRAYRGQGGQRATMSLTKRRKEEATAIKYLEENYSKLLQHAPHKAANSKTMQPVATHPVGKRPLQLPRGARRRKIVATRPSTSTERYRVAHGLPFWLRGKFKVGRKPIGDHASSRQEINKRYYLKRRQQRHSAAEHGRRC